MVLGIRNKTRRGPSIQVEYIIHIQDIKPWPPTQSLKNVRSVLIQWENGERNSGSTSTVSPSVEDGKIEFNESFRLPVSLTRDLSVKNGDTDVFHKNLLEFSLYEPRRDKTVKGQLLGTAILDLAEYGVIKEIVTVSVPVNCTRSFGNSGQPILQLRIQSYDRARLGSGVSLRGRLAKETSLEKNDSDSVSALMSEEYADEAEIGSFTDDDVSSHSSHATSSTLEVKGASQNKENTSGKGKDHIEFSSNEGKPNKIADTLSDTSDSNLYSEVNLETVSSKSGQAQESTQQISEKVTNPEDQILGKSVHNEHCPAISNNEGVVQEVPEKVNNEHNYMEAKDGDKHERNDQSCLLPVEEKHIVGNTSPDKLSSNSIGKQGLVGIDSFLSRDKVRHVKSVRSSMDSSRSNSLVVNTMRHETNVLDKRNTLSDSKTQGLEQRVNNLERELKEAAALEVGLYSVVAEHGNSTNKVHAPARRLSRLYLRAGKGMKRASAAQSAVSGLIVVAKACGNDVPRLTFWLSNCVVLRAIISEAFAVDQLPVSGSSSLERNGTNPKSSSLKWKVSSFDKQANRSSINGIDYEDAYSFAFALEKVESWIFSRIVESVWWQTLTPHMQSSAAQLVNKEVDSSFQKKNRRASNSGNEEQVNLSLELWRKAFKDACERLCPLRAAGHDCGCLPVLSKLVMEQCVARLDVAMFNAILRESTDDIPTDPVSDPISDSKVLPVPAGKSCFGSGAQLKNAIGNWSRWLTDLFGMDDDDPLEDEKQDYQDDVSNKGLKSDSSFKSFYLLKSLSDLMMLPKDMLMNDSIRREVCPAFGAQLIKRVLDIFVPDEFCSEQVPGAVFEALDAESINTEDEGLITNCPCTAPSVFYSPPQSSSLNFVLGLNLETNPSQLRRSSSVLRRSNTSDDELDELDSPLHAILNENLEALPSQIKQNLKMVQNHGKNFVRYQLLREAWGDEDGVKL